MSARGKTFDEFAHEAVDMIGRLICRLRDFVVFPEIGGNPSGGRRRARAPAHAGLRRLSWMQFGQGQYGNRALKHRWLLVRLAGTSSQRF
jgi:hypothetical protein